MEDRGKKSTKKAAGLTAAGQNELHNKAYRKANQLSRLKMLTGEILLFGDKQCKEFWPFFDALLRQYLELRRVTI